MSYLNDPNTHRLATRCLCCGRSLRDAKSVEMGIGPICRSKYLYNDEITEEQRATVNKLIHRAGVLCEKRGELKRAHNTSVDDMKAVGVAVLDISDQIEAIGLVGVAKKVRTRFIGIHLDIVRDAPLFGWTRERGEYATGDTHDIIVFRSPYSQTFNDVRKRMRLRARPVKTSDGFHWEFPLTSKRDLDTLMKRVFAGELAVGPKGIFVVEPEQGDNRAAANGGA